jgi:hypothetical protein
MVIKCKNAITGNNKKKIKITVSSVFLKNTKNRATRVEDQIFLHFTLKVNIPFLVLAAFYFF